MLLAPLQTLPPADRLRIADDLYRRAAALLERNGLAREAAECREEAGDLAGAAAGFAALGDWPRAARLYAEAREVYGRWLEGLPEDAALPRIQALLGQAACTLRLGQADQETRASIREARQRIETVALEDPETAVRAWTLLARFGEQVGRADLVRVGYETALSLVPDPADDRHPTLLRAYAESARGDRLLRGFLEQRRDKIEPEPEPEVEDEPPPTFVNSLGMEFVWIPPGTFLMGSPKGELWPKRTEKQHEVTLTEGFYMQGTPTTVEQWKAFVRAEEYNGDGENGYDCIFMASPKRFPQGKDHPVICVSWKEAAAFCEWLNRTESPVRYRLPTEAEWEYACRSGTETAFYSGPIKQPKGRDPNLEKVGWYGKNSGRTTHPVGQKEPNAWGLYDMHGNVEEWCADWYQSLLEGPAVDPAGPETGAERVVRGGSWLNAAESCRAAHRDFFRPSARFFSLGFRVLAVRRPAQVK